MKPTEGQGFRTVSTEKACNAPNLTPGGELAAWEEADSFKAIREGVAKAVTSLTLLKY